MEMSNGYGQWWPGHEEFLARVRGRVERVVAKTERWEGGIEYSVRVAEAGEDECTIWKCSVEFKPHEGSPSPAAVEAAREQDRIAREIWTRYSEGSEP